MNALPPGPTPSEKAQLERCKAAAPDAWHRFWDGFGRLEKLVLVASLGVTSFCVGLNAHRQRDLPPFFHQAPGVNDNKTPMMRVQVAGSVQHAGVFSLPLGARVEDALRKAGGAASGGNAQALNLAARLKDGERVVVPSRGAAVAASNRAILSAPIASAPQALKARAQVPRVVNINAASAAELEALPGVGPALAARIVAFRAKQGRISSLDELDQVKGFGPKKLEKLRPYAAF